MKTVCFLGSPRRGGNSDTLAQEFLQCAGQAGRDAKIYALSDMHFNGCRNLFRCKTDLSICGQSDELTPVLAEVAKADVLVLATPVYFTSVSGQLKLAIDRFFSFFVPDYPTAARKSRLPGGRHLVFLQTQGEPEDRYSDLMERFAPSFHGLGYENLHLVRASGVREPDGVRRAASVLANCKRVASSVYGPSSDVAFGP